MAMRMRIRWGLPVLMMAAVMPVRSQNPIEAQKISVVVSSGNPRIHGQLFHPQICPNLLNYVAFVRQVHDSRQIWLFDAKSKNLSQLTPNKSSNRIEDVDKDQEEDGVFKGYEDELEWCPVLHQGKQYFAFVSAGGVNNHDIYLGCIGSETLTRVTFDPEVDGSPHWTPDGKSLVFVSARTGDGDLYFIPDVLRFFGKELKQEPREAFERLTGSPGEDMLPAFSPDGRFLAYTTETSGSRKRGQFTIALMDFADDRKISIFNNQVTNNKSHPSWSFDGHFVAYQISNDLKDRVVDIGVMQLKIDAQGHLVEVADLHGSTPRIAENVFPGSYDGPSWLPGSRALIYAKRESSRFNPIEIVNLERWLYEPGYERATLSTQSSIHRDLNCLPHDPLVLFAGESEAEFQIFAAILPGDDVRLRFKHAEPLDYDLFKEFPDAH